MNWHEHLVPNWGTIFSTDLQSHFLQARDAIATTTAVAIEQETTSSETTEPEATVPEMEPVTMDSANAKPSVEPATAKLATTDSSTAQSVFCPATTSPELGEFTSIPAGSAQSPTTSSFFDKSAQSRKMPASLTRIVPDDPSRPFWEKAFKLHRERYGLYAEDNRARGGVLWVRTQAKQAAIVQPLIDLGFDFKPGKGWLYKGETSTETKIAGPTTAKMETMATAIIKPTAETEEPSSAPLLETSTTGPLEHSSMPGESATDPSEKHEATGTTRLRVMGTRIKDLIQHRDVSVRLYNSITQCEQLPLETVGAYMQSGDRGIQMMLSIPNLGRKTVLELDGLIREYVENAMVLVDKESDADDPASKKEAKQGREKIFRLLENIPLREALIHTGLAIRIRNGVELLGDIRSVGDFVRRGQEIRNRLLQYRNFGRGSLKKLEDKVEEIVRLRIRQVSSDPVFAESVTFEELVSTDIPSTFQRFSDLAISPDCEEDVDLDALFSDPIGDQEFSEEERVLRVIQTLPEKEKDVILRRYGMDGFARKSLEDIAGEFFVTRERVRQVESGAIQRLRVPNNALVFRKLLDASTGGLWSVLSGNTGFIPVNNVDKDVIRSNGLLRLAMDVVHDDMHDWLKTTSCPVLGGWLRSDIPAEEFRDDVRRLSDLARNALFPMPVDLAGEMMGMDSHRIRRAIRVVPDVKLFEEHLMKGHLGSQAKRTIHLYRMLSSFQSGRLVDFRILLPEYNRKFPESTSSLRIAELTMERMPHLFKKLFDNFWFTVPVHGVQEEVSNPIGVGDAPIVYATQWEEADTEEDVSSLKQWLKDLIEERGPMRFNEIRMIGKESLPEGNSINSLGPILQTAGEFIRCNRLDPLPPQACFSAPQKPPT